MTLQEIYHNYLKEFKETGQRPYPDRLLALLLLPEKNNYKPLRVAEGKFYQIYKKEIDIKINQVINDFAITKEDIIGYIEAKGILPQEDRYEEEKLWFVFAEGFGVMHGSIMYESEQTPEEAYQTNLCCFHEESYPVKDCCIQPKKKVKMQNKKG